MAQNVVKEPEQELDLTNETFNDGKEFKKEENIADKIDKWVEIIFPRYNFGKSSNNFDEDTISYEESQDRLIAIVLFITMISCLITIVQIIQILTPIKSPIIIEPKMPMPFCKFQISFQ